MTFTAAALTPMARPRVNKPAYEPTAASRALKLRRTEIGKSQADAAFDSDLLTQTTISELERGKYGPEDLTSARLAALAKGLNWTVAELEEATGLDLGLTRASQKDEPSSYPGPIPPVVPFRETPVEIPDELQRMIDNNADRPGYELLRDPRIQRIMAAPRNFGGPENGPQTEDEWLEYWITNRRWFTS